MRTATTLLLFAALSLNVLAWGLKGHQMVNRGAVDASQDKLPRFFLTGSNQLIYNAFEPDRWKEEGPTPLNKALSPDHFLDLELWGTIDSLPLDRFQFMEALKKKNLELERVGYLPYAILEYQGRLTNAFRRWRNAKDAQEREAARNNAIHYAGVMGHFVGDSTMPMHMSIHFNGWADGSPNPRNFTKDRTFHARYEGASVDRGISYERVRPLIVPPQRLTNLFTSVKQHLQTTFGQLVTVYEMEQQGEFNPDRLQPAGQKIITEQLARASTMLASLWLTAWLDSAEPLPARTPQ